MAVSREKLGRHLVGLRIGGWEHVSAIPVMGSHHPLSFRHPVSRHYPWMKIWPASLDRPPAQAGVCVKPAEAGRGCFVIRIGDEVSVIYRG
jgi:hypothetical protein